jgi:hypothetical protein
MVNAHGYGLTSSRTVKLGTQVRLRIIADERSTTARVVEVVPLTDDHKSWLIGLELEQPGNFWDIEYAPADWAEAISPGDRNKLDSTGATLGSSHASAASTGDSIDSVHPIRASQCRLTAISTGACYLQSTESFPVHTHVIVRVRLGNSERTFDGIVRVEHARSGMGVEFLNREATHQNPIDDLIFHLRTEENVFPEVRLEIQNVVSPAIKTKPNVASAAPISAELQDRLLGLILVGPAISRQDFLRELERQRSRSTSSHQ